MRTPAPALSRRLPAARPCRRPGERASEWEPPGPGVGWGRDPAGPGRATGGRGRRGAGVRLGVRVSVSVCAREHEGGSRKTGTHYANVEEFLKKRFSKDTGESRGGEAGIVRLNRALIAPMRLGLCRRNAENRGAGPVPSLEGLEGALSSWTPPFLFGPRFVPFDLALFCSGFPRTGPRKAPESASVSPHQFGRRCGADGLMLPALRVLFSPSASQSLFYFLFFLSFLLFAFCAERRRRERGRGGWRKLILITTIKKSNLQFFGRPDGSH